MRILAILFTCVCCLVLIGCATGNSVVSFKVVDEETGKPIEGAVAIAFLRKYKGPIGLRAGYTAQVEEQVSDRDGVFKMVSDHQSPSFNS